MTEARDIPDLGVQRAELAKLVRLEESDDKALSRTVRAALSAAAVIADTPASDDPQDTSDERVFFDAQTCIGDFLESLEFFRTSLLSEAERDVLEDRKLRALFYANLGLGACALMKREFNGAASLMTEAASTKFSWRNGEIRGGPGTVRQTSGMFELKAWLPFIAHDALVVRAQYVDLAYLQSEARALVPGMSTDSTLEVLDKLAQKCEGTDQARKYDHPDLDWLHLFAFAGRLMQFSRDVDTSDVESPRLCKHDSPQFAAWKFGYLAGKFAIDDPISREIPLKKLVVLREIVGDNADVGRGGVFDQKDYMEEVWQSLLVVDSLLCEYNLRSDWQEMKKHYLAMWQSPDRWSGMALGEVTPKTDLHWAMRVGFADRIIEAMEGKPGAALLLGEAQGDLAKIKVTTESTGIRLVKLDLAMQEAFKKIQDRMPPTPEEVRSTLWRYQVASVRTQLPSKVVNPLVKAERYYSSGTDDDNAKVWFCKAVEASLRYCLVEPLVVFLQKSKRTSITLCFSRRPGSEKKTIEDIRKLSAGEWAQVIEACCNAWDGKDLNAPAIDELKQFLILRLGGPHLPADLKWLVGTLSEVQQCRSGSAHYQDAEVRYETERDELERMRDLVLGVTGPSVIAGIFRLLSHKEVSK